MKNFIFVLVLLLLATAAGCSDPGMVLSSPDTSDQTDVDDVDVIDDGTSAMETDTSDGDPWDDRKITGQRGGQPVGPGPDDVQGE